MARNIVAGTLRGTLDSFFWRRVAHYEDGKQELVYEGAVNKGSGGNYFICTRRVPGAFHRVGDKGSAQEADAFLQSQLTKDLTDVPSNVYVRFNY